MEKNGADGVNEEDESLEYVVNSLKNNINNFVMPLWLRAMFFLFFNFVFDFSNLLIH